MQRIYQPLHHLHSTRQVPQESQQGHHPDHGESGDFLILCSEFTSLFKLKGLSHEINLKNLTKI
jgi:hypothetical protein